jgi:hypothetical protein
MTFTNRLNDLNSIKQAVEQLETLLRVRAELVRTGTEPETVGKINTVINDLIKSLAPAGAENITSEKWYRSQKVAE